MSSQERLDQPYVLVGVDGSPNSVKALRAAVQEATWRNAEVHAVIAWTYPYVYGMEGAGYVLSTTDMEESASSALERAIDEAHPENANVAIVRRVIAGSPAETLIDLSKDAALLVVGARGHGGFLGLLLGSVSSQVVKHAHCPVLVVPPDND